ncbi:MAG: ribose 5-phosphate isomerase B [Clostridia bacterium]|nr:ribose 5-phosphate isomerase B [Clostridia bacterium]
MNIVIASDHGGYTLKTQLAEYLSKKGENVIDVGTYSDVSCDYPDFAQKACALVLSKEADFAILLCGTGIGISIAANKIPKIRCAVCSNVETARLAKEHNNANAIALGGRIVKFNEAKEIVDTYMSASFAGGRHQVRLDKILSIEERQWKI